MNLYEKIGKFWSKHRMIIIAVASVVVAMAFIATILLTMFLGGDEFKTTVEYASAKGMITVEDGCYFTSYLKGDTFHFEKENANVRLLAKDPAIDEVINIKRLPASEYGFLVNGEGDYIDNPSDIVMDLNVNKITLVSRVYRNLQYDLPITVTDGYVDSTKLTNKVTIEAEDANLYNSSGKLLTDEEKRTLPDADKPYISNVGSSGNIKGENCSGGACIRNFAAGMKIEFEVVCSETTNVLLEIHICKRPGNVASFDGGFVTKLNGVVLTTGQSIPEGPAGDYFDPYAFTITVTLQRGRNVITFEKGKDSPGNLDAIAISAMSEDGTPSDSKILGGIDALVISAPAGADNVNTDNGESENDAAAQD